MGAQSIPACGPPGTADESAWRTEIGWPIFQPAGS
jgi:hypothetical protein